MNLLFGQRKLEITKANKSDWIWLQYGALLVKIVNQMQPTNRVVRILSKATVQERMGSSWGKLTMVNVSSFESGLLPSGTFLQWLETLDMKVFSVSSVSGGSFHLEMQFWLLWLGHSLEEHEAKPIRTGDQGVWFAQEERTSRIQISRKEGSCKQRTSCQLKAIVLALWYTCLTH